MDIISDIPDSVLCHILSFLPTKIAVATSILSRRWRHLWEHLQVFDFSDFSFRDHTRFAFFVNSVLAMRRTRDIRKFHLSCPHRFTDYTATWIRAATGPHLQELNLWMGFSDNFHLPSSVFTCSGLVSLTLTGPIRVELLQSVYLPSLKTLILDIDSVGSTDKLFSGCPILETLDLTLTIENAPKMHVPSSLKSLTIDITDMEIEELEIDTPSLEYLDISVNTTCSHFSVINLQNVVEARLEIYNASLVLKLLRALTRATQVLVLHVSTVEVEQHLLYALNLDFPEFGFLLHLELTLPNAVKSEFLLKLLQKCGMLQVLKLRVLTIQWEEPWSLESSTRSINDPNCLRSHLIIFECRGYQGYASEEAFIAYVLQRGLVLKTMTIRTHKSLDLQKKHHILQKLSTIPRASNMCQLNLD